MDFKIDLLKKIAADYPKKGKFSSEDASFQMVSRTLRDELKDFITTSLPQGQWGFEGSAGKGSWTHTPWVSIYDTRVTDRASFGFYIVLVLNDTCDRWALMLTNAASKQINATSPKLSTDEVPQPEGFQVGRIKPGTISKNRKGMGPRYENAAILTKAYEVSSDISPITYDMVQLAQLYKQLVDKDSKAIQETYEKNHSGRVNPFMVSQ